ncbi:MAG: hypothetical protein HY851_02625 [candidate division Zixibacteria bacterium]|nr:hypothetical protein [candidate division Zixibacteria bacterium]
MRHVRNKASISALVGLCMLVGGMLTGCNPEIDLSPAKPEVFRGRLVYVKDPNTVGGSDTDLVELIVQGGTYTFQLQTFKTKLCDSQGKAEGFGANRVNFIPTTVFVGNCDSLHVPRGWFSSAFKGDSLYLSKFDTARNIRYQFDLTK